MRVLLITAYFPPQKSVAAIRPNNWFKELPRHNINVDVITPGSKSESKLYDSNNTVYFVKEKGYENLYNSSRWKTIKRKFKSLLKLLFKWKLPYFDNHYELFLEADKRLKSSRYDLLITTGEPFILFKYAYKLKQKYNQPYLLDYRDGWGCDHAKIKGIQKVIKRFERPLERKYLRSALNYTVAALHIKKENNRIYGFKKGYVVENGVDLSIIRNLTAQLNNTVFTITYTGSLYDEHDLDSFIEAFDKFHDLNKNVLLQFIGVDIKPSSSLELLKKFAEKRSHVVILPPVSHKESLQYQMNSDLLLKFDFTGQSDGLLGAKLYEYAATKRKIITVLSVNDKKTTFFPNRDIQTLCYGQQEIFNALIHNYEEWKQTKYLYSDISEAEINKLSMESQINNFAKWLKSLKK